MKRLKKRERTTPSRDGYAAVTKLAYVCSLIFRIPLLHIIGEKGIAYYSIACEFYIMTGCLFTYGLSEATERLIRYRVKRGQYKNAGMVLKEALFLSVLAGAVSSLVFFFAGNKLSALAGLPLAGQAVRVMALALVFQVAAGVFCGYFRGRGSVVPAIHSAIIKTLFMVTGGLLGAFLLHKYGLKAAALLQNADFAASYGAKGASIGLLEASILGFLHMLLMWLLYQGSIKKQELRDAQKVKEGGFGILYTLAGTAAPFAAYAVLQGSIPLTDGVFFMRMAQEGIDAAALWGSYYGKYLPVIGIMCILISLMGTGNARKIVYCVERDDYREAREQIGIWVHQMALAAIPAAVFLAVFSENLLNLLFQGSNQEAASCLMAGSAAVVLSVFASLFSELLIRLKKMNYVTLYGAAGLLLHVILLPALLRSTKLSIKAVIISGIVFFAVLAVCGFLLVSRLLQYRQEWIRTFAFTLVSSAAAGLVATLLNKVITKAAGTAIALAVGLPVGMLLYLLLLIVIGAVREGELKGMRGGNVLLKIGRMMRLIR